MSIAIGVLMVILAAAFVALPFFDGEVQSDIREAPPLGQLERQKYDAYAAIKEAEFDYQMGKLSDSDFTALREKYAAQAVAAIAALEAPSRLTPHRARARRPGRIAFCPTCGHAVPPRANFCPACGLSLKEAVA